MSQFDTGSDPISEASGQASQTQTRNRAGARTRARRAASSEKIQHIIETAENAVALRADQFSNGRTLKATYRPPVGGAIVPCIILTVDSADMISVAAIGFQGLLTRELKTHSVQENIEGLGSKSFTMDITPHRLMDKALESMISGDLAEKANNRKIQLAYTSVVPPEKETDDDALLYHIDSAIDALLSVNEDGMMPFVAQDIIQENRIIVMRRDVHVGQKVVTPDGTPRAADFSTTVVSRTSQNNSKETLNCADETTDLVHVTGTIDILRNPEHFHSAAATAIPGMMGQQLPPVYFPHVILTSLTQGDTSDMAEYGLPSLFLGLASVVGTMVGQNEWVQLFNQPKLKNLGDLGYEIDPNTRQMPAKPEPLKIAPGVQPSANGKSMSPDQFIATMMHTAPQISLQIELDGPQAWLQKLLLRCSDNDPRAIKFLRSKLDEFTGNNFSNRFPEGAPMFSSPTKYVQRGTYLDKSSELCDFNSVDLLTVLKQTTGDNVIAGEYLRGRMPGTGSSYAAMHDFRESMQALYPTLKITGVMAQVTFHNEFLSAILNAIHASKLPINLEGTSMDVQQKAVVYNPAMITNIQTPTGMFNAGMNAQGSQQFNMGNMAGYSYQL